MNMAMSESLAVTSDLLSCAAWAISDDSARAAVRGAPRVDGEGLVVHAGVGGVPSAGRRAGGHTGVARETKANASFQSVSRVTPIAVTDTVYIKTCVHFHTWVICAASC